MSTISGSTYGAAMTPKELFGYDVISHIGTGAASQIYAVNDRTSGQIYALKHVVRKVDKDERYVQQVLNEFEVGKACKHPTLRNVVDLKTTKKFFGPITEVALVMELIDGVGIDDRNLVEMKDILDVFIHVAEGLYAMHKAGYVHCDMKPHNVLICTDGTVKVIDFGQACKIGSTKERVQGTPSFIAPEQARCKPLTEQTDVYNFGASLYWALTRTRVPTLLTVDKADRRVVKEQDYPSPGQLNERVSPQLSELVMACLRLRPNERIFGMSKVLMRLQEHRVGMR
ncbi:MAG TPA: serine/threonine-protein kinase [Tepidisphaeraceae bacterium]|nr:serine/threonine-protein kinase [Tepidisphaeraceae bacterium]